MRRWCGNTIYCIVILLFVVSFSSKAEGIEPPAPEIREVKEILITGNYQTKRKVILTEVPFSLGSLISEKYIAELAERAKQNLLNTTLFNYVSVTYQYPGQNEVIFEITVEERWYIWVFPVFEQEGRNFSDFLRLNDGSYFNYGIYFKHDNLRGRNETLKIRMVTGYKNQMVLDYENPALNNRWGWGLNLGWMVYDQMPYATVHDKQVFLKLMGENIMRQTRIQISSVYRHNHDHRHRLSLAYLVDRVADTLLALNPNYLPFGNKRNQLIEFGYKYQYDKRDSKVYPLVGSFYELSVLRRGLGLVSDYKGFFQGKIVSSWHIDLLPRLYANTKITLSGIDKEEVPYVFKAGLGYEEYLNGFEYRVIDGASFGAIQNKMLFELIPRKDVNLGFIPLKQFSKFHYAFYLKLHFDAGYVHNEFSQPNNEMANSMLVGYGLGIDMVTFYDKVLSLNYSMNNFGGRGLFVHFNLAM